jgi:magnesium-transporting ATPase (P-type)
MIFSEYTNKSVEDALKALGSFEEGLTKKECLLAQKKYGLNEIKAKNVSAFDILIRQFKSPFSYLLFIAALIAIVIGEKVDSITILSFILINIVVGFLQEYRAEKAVSLLQKFIPRMVKVRRDSKEEIIDKKFLVPGDIVLLQAGDIANADMRVISAQNFSVNESALTGESGPVSKVTEALLHEEEEIFEAKNIIFSGSSIIRSEEHTSELQSLS